MPLTLASVTNRNILLGDGVGTTGAPGSYFGFGQAGTSPASTGPRIQAGVGDPSGVVTSPIGSQWTDSASGIVYTNMDGATGWVVSGGGGAVGNWFPLIAQSPLDAKTDYFSSGAVIDPKWTDWDAGANTTNTQSTSTRLKMVQTTHAGNTLAGLFQTAPASARYAITARVGTSGVVANFISAMLFVAGDLVTLPAAAPIVTIEQGFTSTPVVFVSVSNWAAYNNFSAAPFTANNLGQGTNMLRIFVDTVAATYSFLTSSDGLTWTRWTTVTFAASSIGAAPTTMGVCMNNQNSGADATTYFLMFRVDSTTDAFLPCGGLA
jgi:hypothetical protein